MNSRKSSSVKKIVEKIYRNMPTDFNIYKLKNRVLTVLHNQGRNAAETSIKRSLRELKNDSNSIVNYKVINARKGTYKKLVPEKEGQMSFL